MTRQARIRIPKFPDEIAFPHDPRNGTAWDRFWEDLLAGGHSLRYIRLEATDGAYRGHIATLHDFGMRRVLFAGNGITVLPYLFAHCGLQAVAVDISSVATDFAAQHPPEEALFLDFFSETSPQRHAGSADILPHFDPEKTRQAMHDARRSGGSQEFLREDLFTYEPGDGAFGAIVMNYVAEHYPANDRHALAERLYSWLAPGGILVIESRYDQLKLLNWEGSVKEGLEEPFEAAGFLVHLREAYVWRQEAVQAKPWQIFKLHQRSDPVFINRIKEDFDQRAQQIRLSDFAHVREGRRLVIFRLGR
jgi:SAM-dependent methyltransferase